MTGNDDGAGRQRRSAPRVNPVDGRGQGARGGWGAADPCRFLEGVGVGWRGSSCNRRGTSAAVAPWRASSTIVDGGATGWQATTPPGAPRRQNRTSAGERGQRRAGGAAPSKPDKRAGKAGHPRAKPDDTRRRSKVIVMPASRRRPSKSSRALTSACPTLSAAGCSKTAGARPSAQDRRLAFSCSYLLAILML